MANSSTLPGLQGHDGTDDSIAGSIGRLRTDADLNAGEGEGEVDVSRSAPGSSVDLIEDGDNDDLGVNEYGGFVPINPVNDHGGYIPQTPTYVPQSPRYAPRSPTYVPRSPAYVPRAPTYEPEQRDANPPTYEIGDYVPPNPEHLDPPDDDSTSNTSTANASDVAEAVSDAIRSLVPAVIEQITPVIRDVLREEMATEGEEVSRRRRELEDNVRSLGTRLNDMNTKMDGLRAEIVDAVNTNKHATEAKFDDLYLSMTKCFGYVDTRIDTLIHAVDTGEQAVIKAIKLHESTTTSASDHSTTVILNKIEKSSRGLRKHNLRQAHGIQDETDKHLKNLSASIDKLGKDGIKLPAVLKELSQIGDQIGEPIKQQTAEVKAYAEAAAVTQAENSEKIRSFRSEVVGLRSDVDGHRRNLYEWEQASRKQSQVVQQAGNFVYNTMVKMESLFIGSANSLQSAVAPVGGDLKRMADACEELNTRSRVLTETIQTNVRNDLTAFSNDMKQVGDERSRKIMLQESKAYGLHAMYLRPQEKRNTLYVLFMIESTTFKDQLPFQTAIPTQRCTKVANILSEAWEKCYVEAVPKELKKRCVKTEVFLEESVWDQMEELPLVVGSEYEDNVYGEWYERNVEFGIKNHFKIRVEMERTLPLLAASSA